MPKASTNKKTVKGKSVSKKTVDAVYEEPEKGKKTVSKKTEPEKQGLSEATKGMIVGILITGLLAAVIVLLILAKKDGVGNSNLMKDFNKYYNSKEASLIVFASSQCTYCIAQKPIIENIAKEYDMDYLYLDYLELTSAETNEVVNKLGIEKSTPISVVVQNGKVIKVWEGYTEGKEYVANLVSAGVLKSGSVYSQEAYLTSINYTKFKELLNGSTTSAILLDQGGCTLCTVEREFLNTLAKTNKVPVYWLSGQSISDAEAKEFIDSLGKWGYDTPDYKESKSVAIPLLMFVKDGKLVKYHIGFDDDGETTITNLFKTTQLIK